MGLLLSHFMALSKPIRLVLPRVWPVKSGNCIMILEGASVLYLHRTRRRRMSQATFRGLGRGCHTRRDVAEGRVGAYLKDSRKRSRNRNHQPAIPSLTNTRRPGKIMDKDSHCMPMILGPRPRSYFRSLARQSTACLTP